MMQTLTPDPERATIAALAAVAMLTAPSAFVQVSVIVLGGVAGALLLPAEAPPGDDALPLTVRRCTGTILLVLSFALLAGLPLLAAAVPSQTLKLIDVFYRAGSLVFGGGHVVLPLLQAAVVPQGWSATTHSLRAMAPPRLCPGRSSPSPPISARRWDRLQTAGRARLSVSSRSSCSSSARFRSARICAGAQARARHLVASMPLWSVCSSPPSTIPSGRSASPTHGTSRLPCGLPLALRLAGAALGRGHPLCFRWRPHRGRLRPPCLDDAAHHAAVDPERGASDRRGAFAGEEHHEIGDLVRLGEAADYR